MRESDDRNHDHERANGSEPPLNAHELIALRKMIEDERRMTWFWGGAKKVSIWLAAVIGAMSLGWDLLVRIVLHLVGK